MSRQNFDITSAVQMAHQLYQSQRYHECIDICIQILGIDYTQAQVWSLAGMVMLELKSFERAIAYFSQAMQYEPTQPNHTINCAEAYRRSGNPERCIAEIKMLLRQNTAAQNNSNLHFNLAKAYSDIGDSNHSIKHYTIAIKLDPNDLGAMFNLANAQVKLKNFGEAIELYLNALSKGYLDAGVNLANTY
ncbi:lipopolysaccharide assembly protein LapB, partial [uncultured Helicobacter sp.]